MLNTRTSQLVLLSLVLAWFAAPTFGQQFVFDFEDVQLPTEGFNNGNPNSVALGGAAVTSIITKLHCLLAQQGEWFAKLIKQTRSLEPVAIWC